MAKMIYTCQTNSLKIIKTTFSIYDLPHQPVIFLINLGIFNCFENSNRAEKFPTNCADLQMVGGGGAVAHLNFRHMVTFNTTVDVKCTCYSSCNDVQSNIKEQ